MCWHPSRWTNTRVVVQLIPCTSMFIISSNTRFYINVTTSIASPQVISPRLRVSGCVVPFFFFMVVLAPEPFEVLRQVATPSMGIYMSRDLLQGGSTFSSTFMLWRFHPKCRVGHSRIQAFWFMPSFSSQGALSFCFECGVRLVRDIDVCC